MIRRIEIGAAEVVTVDETASPESVRGAIVRLKPSAGIGDDELSAVVAAMREEAAALKVLPRLAADRVATSHTPDGSDLPKSVRAFLEGLLRGSQSPTADRVREYVGELMDREGI